MENFELIQPYFSALINPKYNIYRSRIDRDRFYFAIINNELVKLPSATTILSATLPMEDWLVRWISRWGYEKAMEKRNEAAHYGTLFSIIVSDFLRRGEIDLGTIEARINNFRLTNNINLSTEFWEQRLKEDLYSLYCFIEDYRFEPLAVELPLISVNYKFAGTLDTIGYIQIGSGVNGKILKKDKELRKVLCIIDWKTGRHGFYRSHEAQLQMYRLLVEENFPELVANHELKLYNWAPKEWFDEDDPKYSIKDQTESKEALRILNYIAIYQVDEKEKNNKIKILEGNLRIGAKNGNLKYLDYSDIVRKKMKIEPKQTIIEEEDTKHSTKEFDSKTKESNEKIDPREIFNHLNSFFQQIKEEQ